MLIKFLKACVPPIFVIVLRKLRSSGSNDDLFEGNESMFKDEVSRVDVYGEYGCGKSTNWVLDNTSAKVISVETSSDWAMSVKKHNQINIDRLDIHLSDLGIIGEWGRPLSYDKNKNFSDYTDYIWKRKMTPKLVLVDGRFRVCCFLTSLKFAKEGTKIIFDDYIDRPYYHFVEKYLPREMECGRQCLFIVPSKSKIDMNELNKDIDSFRNVMD
tara:strand:- start:197 stop:838 length:642 start_codon:yes stop_codon:yes gene_type:complete